MCLELADLLSVGRRQYCDIPRLSLQSDTSAVGAQCDGVIVIICRGAVEIAQLTPSRRFPQLKSPIGTSRDQHLSVSAECETVDSSVVRLDRPHFACTGRVPHFERAVLATRNKESSVRTEGQAERHEFQRAYLAVREPRKVVPFPSAKVDASSVFWHLALEQL